MKTLLHRLLPVFLCLVVLSGCSIIDPNSAERNNYGSTHGLVVGGLGLGAGYVLDRSPSSELFNDVLVSALVAGAAHYYYKREESARDEASFDEWYTDSQADALVPALVAAGIIWWRWQYDQKPFAF